MHVSRDLDRIKQESATSTMSGKDSDVYQKITALSNDGTKLAIASSKDQVSLIPAILTYLHQN